jgi:CYTH domain-containing protein
MEIELERTFLAKYLPNDLDNFPSKQMQDNYIPKQARHPVLRIRKNREKFTITKKYPKSQKDNSIMIEETINLTQEEYHALQQIDSKTHKKIRYQYKTNNSKICEIDIYQDNLKGLVIIDFEFNTIEEKNNFIPPDFCLVEVTQEEFIAGGYLCGKSYEDIQEELEKFGYKKL